MNTKKIHYTRKNIDTSYIDEAKRTELREELEYIESFLNNEIRNSLEKEGLEFSLDNIEALRQKPDAIKPMIEKQRDKYIKSLGFIPIIEKNRIIATFSDVIDRLLPNNRQLHDELKKHNHRLIQDKSGAICFDPKEIDDHIETIGIRTFTPIEVEYINILQDAAELLCKAQHMEVDHSFRPYAFGLLVPFGNVMFIDGLARDLSTEIDIVDKFSRTRTFKIVTNTNNN